MNKKRGLGKGLGDLGLHELLSDIETPAIRTEKHASHASELHNFPVNIIQPGRYQPRKTITTEALEELVASIKEQGIIQPIIVRPFNQGYEIIAGERRWRAAQLAGLDHIPAIVRNVSDTTAMAMALIENIQRRDLNPLEEAAALQRLLAEFQMTHQEVADAIGKSRVAVTNLLRLLKLNTDVKALIEQGHLEMGHARALVALEESMQSEVANNVVARALSVRETEQLIRRLQETSQKQNNKETPIYLENNTTIIELQKEMTEKLGTKVVIKQNNKGKGKLVIFYNGQKELDGILEHIY